MTDILKTPKSIILPDLMDVEDEKVKRVLEEYNRVFSELITAVYSDVSWLYEGQTEESTWTPVLEFGGNSVGVTYNQQEGLYIKIGNVVIVNGYIWLTAKGASTGNATISGLPFTPKDDDTRSSVSLRLNYISFANVYQGYIAKNVSSIILGEITEVGSRTTLTNANFTNDSSVTMSAIYFTD